MTAFDIFMITFREPNAEENWARLQASAPRARRIDDVAGMMAPYAACAAAARTPFFFSVDADNWMLDGFDFAVPFEPRADEIASWAAVNPINGLAYGHGCIKLFPTAAFRQAADRDPGLDFVATLVPRKRFVDVPASEHRFNTGPRETWSTAFRECAKQAVETTTGGIKTRARARRRLEIWCNAGADRRFGEWCILGARQGRDYGLKYCHERKALDRINDYAWLRRAFQHAHGGADANG